MLTRKGDDTHVRGIPDEDEEESAHTRQTDWVVSSPST